MNEVDVIQLVGPGKDWIDYMAALLTPMIAIFGTIIAVQQWRTNRARLKHELFDRRYRQFEVVRDFIGSIMGSGRCNMDQQNRYVQGITGMHFLFDRSMAEYADEAIWRPAVTLDALESELKGLPPGEERTKIVQQQRELKERLHEELKSLEERFGKYLHLYH